MMLSIQRLGTASEKMVKYYTDLASKTAYYLDDAEPSGLWYGKLAARQGLLGKAVTHKTLVNYSSGYDKKGKPIVFNAGEKHQMGHDLVFSAPKSVSVLFGLADEETRQKVQAAQLKAVEFALDYAEQHILGIRIGNKGERAFLNTRNAMFAIFEHGSSRKLDPLLHHHCVLMNLSERSPSKHNCIESKNLYRHKKALGAIYRAELSHQLIKNIGLEVEEDGDFFKVTGVPDSLCDLFSKRSHEMAEALEKSGFSGIGAKTKNLFALSTRSKKKHHSRSHLHDAWKHEAKQLAPECKIHINRNHSVPSADTLKACQAEILNDVINSHSVFERRNLIEATQQYAQWLGVGAQAAVDFVDELIKLDEVVTINHPIVGKCYSTKRQMQMERCFYESAIGYARLRTHCLDGDDIASSNMAITLNTEQRLAFDAICGDQSNLVMLNGKPGTGKSYLMGAIAEIYSQSGYCLQGCALAGSAADELTKSSNIPSQTIDSLLHELENSRKALQANTLLVIDEAGMIGVNKLNQLLQYAFIAKSKVVLLGDYNQLPPIQAGASFHRLIQHIKPLELNEIKRQKDKVDRKNIESIGAGDIAEVLQNLKQRDLFNFHQDHLACKSKLVSDWHHKATANTPEAIMLASTRHDVADLNLLARAKLKETGTLPSTQITIQNHNSENLDLSEGDRIMFRQNNRKLGVKNGTLGHITAIKKHRANSIAICVQTDDGKTVDFKLADYDALEYGYAMSVHKSQGKTVDHAFVWLNDRFINRELSYVQMSRSRHSTQVYAASSTQTQDEYLQAIGIQANEKTSKYEFWQDEGIAPINGDLEPIWF